LVHTDLVKGDVPVGYAGRKVSCNLPTSDNALLN